MSASSKRAQPAATIALPSPARWRSSLGGALQ